MQIGIIGAGNIGATLARRFVELGHDVTIANSREPETIRDVADSCGATAATAADATRGAELVVVTIPEKSVPKLHSSVLDGAPDAVVVDTGNYYPGATGRSRRSRTARPRASGSPSSSAARW